MGFSPYGRPQFDSGSNGPMDSFNLQPHLIGELLELRPPRPEDWEPLFAVAADPLIWEVHPARGRYKEEHFRDYFREALESGGALVAIDRKTQQIIGASRYFWYRRDRNEAYWGGVYNREMKRLMLDYALQFVDRVIFLVGVANVRSQRAMAKIGGILTDRRVQRSLHGNSSDFVIFEIRRLDAPGAR